jgi:type III restriction enzyme
MKLKFKKQQYQTEAASSVVDVFVGQKKGFRENIVGRKLVDGGLFGKEYQVQTMFSNNPFTLSYDDILNNLQEVQKRNNLPIDRQLHRDQHNLINLSVEMETGTGKTYVYTKQMFELNRQYGWSKFIIMVPSVAIREGVKKSLEITRDHFQGEYGKKIRFFIYNTKDKSNLVNIKSFANSGEIEVIIMNYQAFGGRGQDALKIYQELDQLQSQKPIDIIKQANPILIIDEPQRFGPKAEEALVEFNPLFITRYSATHKKNREFNKIYRLDAIDAFNEKLVKKIKVIGIDVDSSTGVNQFLFLDKINISKHSYPTASIHLEFEVKGAQGIKKKTKIFKEGDNLFEYSGLQQYKGYVIKEINGATNTVSFTNGITIGVGQVHGDVNESHLRRIQIRETIKSHIDKERELFNKGIKVLSLFFIDTVEKYRKYDESGELVKSEYEKIFEEEYTNIISEQSLFDEEYNAYLKKFDVEAIHNGYFSIDKKGKAIDSKESRGQEGSDDISAYDLIMKDKERLLSFNESTRFIFSHSALREGWDNPNIFQICTLKHSDTSIGKRQEIGRGLRIAVDEHGNRMDHSVLGAEFHDVNKLTVIASESYDTFAKELQKEILNSLSDRPIELTQDVLVGKVLINSEGKEFIIDAKVATKILMSFSSNGYIDEDLKVTEKFIVESESDTVKVPDELQEFKQDFINLIGRIYHTDKFQATENESDENLPKELVPNENFNKREFKELWDKIKVKTSYTVKFDDEELIKKSISSIDKNLFVKKINVVITEGEQQVQMNQEDISSGQNIQKGNVSRENAAKIYGNVKYDLIDEIASKAILTRKTVVKILQGINANSFAQFKANPEDFIRKVVELIRNEKAATLINNIQYNKIDDEYTDDIFAVNNFSGSLKTNVLEVKKHIYHYVKTDSDIERRFAQDMENGDEIFVYAKLPHKFKISTPVGNYNPDWAIVFDTEKVKYIYFIAETKGSMDSLQLKGSEELKIEYAKKHFASLNDKDIKFDVVDSYQNLLNILT